MLVMNEVPAAIKNLKLQQAFKGYTPGVSECAEVSTEPLQLIVDDQHGTHRIPLTDNDEGCCVCKNPNGREVVLLPLDKGLIKNRLGGMCDGTLFDERLFYFVEFKDQAEGKTDAAIQYTYEKAQNQLTQGLKLFDEKLRAIDIKFRNQVDVTCVVILSEQFPRHRATEQDMMVTFAQQHHGVPLSFDRTIHFD